MLSSQVKLDKTFTHGMKYSNIIKFKHTPGPNNTKAVATSIVCLVSFQLYIYSALTNHLVLDQKIEVNQRHKIILISAQ